MTLSPPTSGIYQGMCIFQDRTVTQTVAITGNGSMNISGTFYAADALMTLTGQGSLNVIGSQYISRYLTLTGQGNFSVNWNANTAAPNRLLGLIE